MEIHSELFQEVMSRLSEQFGMKFSITKQIPSFGGCINNASAIETNIAPFFIKWNTNLPADVFIREAEGLGELKKANLTELKIPEVILVNKPCDQFHFLVLEYLQPGSSKCNDENLGRGLAEIHRCQSTNYGFYHNNYCGETPQLNEWRNNCADFYIENRIGYLVHKIQKKWSVPATEITLFDKLAKKIRDVIPDSEPSSLIHGDLWAGNYMQTSSGPALIDPAVSFSNREMEFGIITLFGGFSTRFFDAYNESYPLEPGWKNRIPLYQLYHNLNHFLMFGGNYWVKSLSNLKSYIR